jgi:adenylate cyclase
MRVLSAGAWNVRRVGFIVAVALTAVLLALGWTAPRLIERLENQFLDLRFVLRGTRDPGADIAIVAVDEASLKAEGRWPWSRDKQARLIETIAAEGARVIAVDLLYPEPETTEFQRVVQGLVAAADEPGAASARLRQRLRREVAAADADRRFAAALNTAGNVVLALALFVPPTTAAEARLLARLPAPVSRSEFPVVRRSRSGTALEPFRATEAQPPLEAFLAEAAGLGHVYSLPDADGVTRVEYLALAYGDHYLPSLGLEAARLALGVPRERMALVLGSGVQLGDRFIPTDRRSRLLIDYAGPPRTFPYHSAVDVLRGRTPPGALRDRVVLVGTAALGTYDQKATPFSANVPGVEKNATVVENILRARFVTRGLWAEPLAAGAVLLFGLGFGALLPRLRAVPAALVGGLCLAGYAGAAHAVFVWEGLWVDVVWPLLTGALVFVALTVLRFWVEERRAREIRTMFSSYVSPRIVEELIKDPAKARLGGERRVLTMLFCDLAGFTGFSEHHEAEAVVAQLNEYLEAMTEVIFHWHGTLDKFVGDAIVVFWGAPIEQPDHVERALKCALHMRKRLAELQRRWLAQGREPFEHGIGINTGPVVVGNIGAEGRKMDYTMIGDHANLAARAQTLTRRFGCPIVLTESTAGHLKRLLAEDEREGNRGRIGHVSLRRLGLVRVKGKAAAVTVYGLESLDREAASTVQEEGPTELLE